MEHILSQVLEEAKKAGAQEADVIVTQSTEVEANYYQGVVDEYRNATNQGLGLRVLTDGRVGYAYSESFENPEELAKSAVSVAEVTSPDESSGLYTGTAGDSGTGRYTFCLDEKQVLETAKNLYDVLSSHPDVGDLYRCSAAMGGRTHYYANTRGVSLHQGFSYGEVVAAPIVQRNDYRQEGISFFSGPSLAGVDYAMLTDQAVERGLRYAEAESMQSGQYPVVIHGEAMVDLLGAFASIFSGQRALLGLSLLRGKEGQKIASPLCTLMDTPYHAGFQNTGLFDGEGVPQTEKPLIDKGILSTLLYDVKSANKAGRAPTGNGARGYASPVVTAPNNLVLEKGDASLSSLLAEAGNGMLVYEVGGLHAGANDTSGDFSLLCKGQEIVNGKLGKPITQVVLSGNFYQLLQNIARVGDDVTPSAPGFSCITSPSVLVRNLAVAGE